MSWMVWQVSQETCSTRMGQRGTFSLPGGSKYFSTGNKTQLLLTTIEHVNYPPPQERDMESSSHTAKLSQCFFLWGEAHTREAFFHLFKYIKKMFLQCCVDFYHTSTWLSHRYTNVPWLEPSSHFPLHPTAPGCHRTGGLSSLCHTANSYWLSILHMAIYMFQWYSPNLSHPLLPPPPSQVCSLCQAVGFFTAEPPLGHLGSSWGRWWGSKWTGSG